MPELLAKTLNQPMENPLAARRKTAEADVAAAKPPMMESLGARTELAGLEKGMEAGRAADKQAAISGVQEEFARKAAEAPQREQMQQVIDRMGAPFVPTQENANDLAGLFSLINIVGFAMGRGGKQSAQQAMSAMNGMMEGYQQGRADRYKQEKSIFDTNLKQLKTTFDVLDRGLKDAVDTYARDRDAGLQKAEETFARTGSDFYKKYAEKYGLAAAYEYHKQIYDTAQKALDKVSQEEQRAADKATAERHHQERMAIERQKLEKKGGATSALLAGRAENIREAFAQAAKDIVNITRFPKDTMLGTFAGLTGASADGMVSGIRNGIARGITDKEQRMLETLISGIEGHMAFALGGGYATSQSKARMDQYKAQIARAGDDPAQVPLMLSRFRQEMNILAENFPSKPGVSPEMNEAVQRYNNEINKAVPYTVDDVLTAELNPPQSQPPSPSTDTGDWKIRRK